MLTFGEFKASAFRHSSPESAAKTVNLDPSDFGPRDEIAAIWTYDSGCWLIEKTSGQFVASIESNQHHGSQEQVERALYVEWYWYEVVKSHTERGLQSVLDEYCNMRGVPFMPIEQLAESHGVPAWFIENWSAAYADTNPEEYPLIETT